MNYFYILIIQLVWISNIFSQWSVQNSGVTVALWDVCFTDTLHGWAIGDSARIINTTDGGNTWQIQTSPVDTVRLEKLCFVNDSIGYIVGWNGTILSTKNGGLTWDINTSPVDYALWDVTFINEDTGWVAGSDFYQTRKRGVILNTKDGGQTWEIQFETNSPGILGAKLFRAIRFVDEENGWALAGDYFDNFSSTFVYYTTNGGINWVTVGVAGMPFWHMSIVVTDTIWAGGFGFGRSHNGGVTWDYPFVSAGTVADIAQFDVRKGWIVTAHLNDKRILLTEDDGTTWIDFLIIDGPTLIAISNIGYNYLWSVGDSGSIMHYKRQINSKTKEENLEPQDFSLLQNYPNPFNTNTIISFFIKTHEFINLTVYDIRGKNIVTLISKKLSPAIYSVTWDGRNSSGCYVSSGVYIYKLYAGKFTALKKAVLIR